MKASIAATTALVLTLAQSALAQTPCAAQTVFDQCKKNEDNYLATCQQNDFACLCKWQTAKVSCWDNCPNDSELHTQQGLMTTYCSQPGANVTSAAPSSVAPATTNALPSSSASSSSSAASSSGASSSSEHTNAGNALAAGQVATLAASGLALAAYYML